MQINGDLPWMQNWAQNAAQKKANMRINPLLEQVQTIMERQSDTKASDPISKEMKAKLVQLDKESKVDPADKAIRRAMKELAAVDQDMYGALFNARLELRDLTDKQEAFTGILNGTANYGKAVNDWYIDYEDRGRFSFTDFDTYLVEKGYQGDGTKPMDLYNLEWTTAENSLGMNVGMFKGQVLVKEPGAAMEKVIYEDQVPLYEQWKEEKKAFEVAALKEYAAEKLPQVQKSIENFPDKINQIFMAYSAKKAAIIAKLPKDALKDEYLTNMESISGLAKEMQDIKPGDGKALLNLLNQMMERQGENTVSLGGVANNGFERIKNGRLPWDYYA